MEYAFILLSKETTQVARNVKSLSSQVNLTSKNSDENNLINLKKDTKRQEIGFEQETVLDSGWKEIRVDYKKLLSFYSKLSKRNLTG